VREIRLKTGRLTSALTEAEGVSRERAALLKEAQDANAVKSRFVSMVSHELRTPLTSIKGALELIDSGATGPVSEATGNLVSIAVRNSQRLAQMIDDLLDLEKLGAGKLRFDFAPLDVSSLIDEAVHANQSYAQINNVRLQFAAPDRAITVRGDQNRLMQVMANLLSNAAKFSHPDSVVTISMREEGDTAVIDVKDTGIGMPTEAGESIFDTFVQIDSSDRRAVGGSGLGLSIARSIVDQHGGTLSYSSREGQGTTFSVALPILGRSCP